MYDQGIRAYCWVDGKTKVTFLQDKDGEVIPHEGIYIWPSLRAYQDEQRKKGEPMVMTLSWRPKSYPGFKFGDMFDGYDLRPAIYVNPVESGGHLVGYTGMFTNFRWRPGHGPKATTCASPNCHALGCDDCFEKGGNYGIN